MPEVEINEKGEYKFTIQHEDIPAKPPRIQPLRTRWLRQSLRQ